MPKIGIVRSVDDLLISALSVIEVAAESSGPFLLTPLFSGGHDSLCATHLASQSKYFTGKVYHIDTGIGAQYTRRFVEEVCESQGWRLEVLKSNSTFEQFCKERGLPGPERHQWIYNRLKDRCISSITSSSYWIRLLITGCRKQESKRRMGSVKPIKTEGTKRVWVALCYDWSKAEQCLYMDEMGLPTNRVKVAVGLSGECFCGAFARKEERELIREHAPDVEKKILRAEKIARDAGMPCVWGQAPSGIITVAETGPMCSSCDQRAAVCGIIVKENL